MKTLAEIKEKLLRDVDFYDKEIFNLQYRILVDVTSYYHCNEDVIGVMAMIASFDETIDNLKSYFSLEEKENHVCPKCEENLKVIEGLRNHLKTYEKMDEFNQKRIRELEEKNKSLSNVQS